MLGRSEIGRHCYQKVDEHDLTPRHRWELPGGNYHGIRGNYHYPFLGVKYLVILHDFIRKNYHKNQSDRYPFFLIMVNYPTFLINYHILNFQMYYQYLFPSHNLLLEMRVPSLVTARTLHVPFLCFGTYCSSFGKSLEKRCR